VSKSILVIEDDPAMARVMQEGLEQDSYSVVVAHNGWKGLELAQRSGSDAIVLDVMLPGLNGLALARELRMGGNLTPILMLTARDDVPDIVAGLDAGAEDYLTKPFSFVEFLARVRALTRRGKPEPVSLVVADLHVDLLQHTVSRGGIPIDLARTEFLLLELLVRNAGAVVSREQIAAAVWKTRTVEPNAIDVAIRNLRVEMDQPYPEKLIHTVRGFGYKLAQEHRFA
jgi:two-component system copper resistance phosphate regulon response regulator CusR